MFIKNVYKLTEAVTTSCNIIRIKTEVTTLISWYTETNSIHNKTIVYFLLENVNTKLSTEISSRIKCFKVYVIQNSIITKKMRLNNRLEHKLVRFLCTFASILEFSKDYDTTTTTTTTNNNNNNNNSILRLFKCRNQQPPRVVAG
jgi:hypothetical protein